MVQTAGSFLYWILGALKWRESAITTDVPFRPRYSWGFGAPFVQTSWELAVLVAFHGDINTSEYNLQSNSRDPIETTA